MPRARCAAYRIVTGDVFHNAAAGFGLASFVVYRGDADTIICRTVRRQTTWPADLTARVPPSVARSACGIRSAPLILRREEALKVRESNTGLDRDGHVASGIIDDGIKSAIDGIAAASGRQADMNLRLAADRIIAWFSTEARRTMSPTSVADAGRNSGTGPWPSMVQELGSDM